MTQAHLDESSKVISAHGERQRDINSPLYPIVHRWKKKDLKNSFADNFHRNLPSG